jgi:hypothetical protein
MGPTVGRLLLVVILPESVIGCVATIADTEDHVRSRQ